jgi:hypothetical protein
MDRRKSSLSSQADKQKHYALDSREISNHARIYSLLLHTTSVNQMSYMNNGNLQTPSVDQMAMYQQLLRQNFMQGYTQPRR